eukprot:jgi/Bigna1/67886/fgenesh1_pg.4_\
MAVYLNVLNIILLIISMIFALVGLAAIDAQRVGWSRNEIGGNTINYGLVGLESTETGLVSLNVNYDDSTCTAALPNSDACDRCEQSGDAIIAFLVFGLAANIIALYHNGAKAGSQQGLSPTPYIFVLIAVTIFYFLCWTVWQRCHEALQDNFDDVELHTGFALLFISFILMPVVVIISYFNGEYSPSLSLVGHFFQHALSA